MTDQEIAEALEIMTEAEIAAEKISNMIESAAMKIVEINK